MLNPEEIYRKLVDAGESWSDLDAAADIMERAEKSLFSNFVLDALKNGATSVAKAEYMARSDERYVSHGEQTSEARKKANSARVRYESLKTLAELRRTEAATRRAEMQLT